MNEDKIRKSIGLLFILAIAVIIIISLFAGFIIDYLWFSSLNYTGVFWTIKLAWFFFFFLFAILGFAVLFGNFFLAYRVSRKEGPPAGTGPVITFEFGEYTEPLKQLAGGVSPQRLNLLLFLAAAVIAVLTGLTLAPQWEQFLRYFNQMPFGKTDPIFNRDIGFYVFSLPVYKLLRGWLLSLIVFSCIGSGVIYWFTGMFRIAGRSVSFSKSVKFHLYTLVAIGLLMKVWDYRLQMFDLLYSRSGLVFGAGYTDYHVHRLALWFLLLYMLVLAIFTISGIFSSQNRAIPLVVALVLIIPLVAVFRGVLPGIVQQMIVKPNELTKEEPFIKNNIEMTNAAYGLSDIAVKPFSVENSITLEGVRNNEETVNNIRLWDPRPLLSTYQQIQAIRTYYTFHNVDVDRYALDGKVRQVMLAPRELDKEKLEQRAQTWVNLRLTFTHGYGLVMNPVNSVTGEGLPELFIKDIPPVSLIDIPIEQPAVYYGERFIQQVAAPPGSPGSPGPASSTDDYVIVKTNNPEFDYPAGDENKYVTYEGTGGVRMGSLFRRLLFAWGFRDINILLTSATTDESRMMFRRNIQERIKHIVPFLKLDQDPYIVLSEGRLFWIQDAYTFSDRYPYSDPVGRINYIRNSVKIVVDAYHGSVDFYLVDKTDPMVTTYQKIFPGLFKDFDEMPDGIRSHIRYPGDLFDIQIKKYTTYHMKDPKVFYNKEDLWTIPNEIYDAKTTEMDPYYIQMRLPGEENLEFILMNPLTPNNKDNMIAWFAARCDGEHYGELLVYKFSKEKLIYGPSQIEARIDQNTLISQQFSLWDQRGSNIIRGNLLVIPIEESILYVEPVYLKAEQRELPELKRVIVSHGGEVVMGMNLQEALEAAFGGKLTEVEQQLVEQAPVTSLEEEELEDVIQRLTNHFNAARKHLSEGNWSKYGEEMDKAEEVINMLQQKYGKQE
jgi:uncharacterized membrane protein (UPF0182 family)